MSNDALSRERIAEVSFRATGGILRPMDEDEAETILALIDERARLIAVVETAEYVTRKFGDEYEGRLGPLNEALAALDAWKAGTCPT